MFSLNINIRETTYYQKQQRNKMKQTNIYYKNNKEDSREKAKSNYKELSEEERNTKTEYGRNK